ncbi:hypothetical protein ZIOFF_066524 [Zingiber officinale]|uniref:RING-type E3 ubiquitin transferase n=1 Tax=Zingiber officinale TaxID=94328 RepID=A0A8J5KC63_ZINOF|nr:hypothetical protein ZIOFF_066524 [Zingiber officinale]
MRAHKLSVPIPALLFSPNLRFLTGVGFGFGHASLSCGRSMISFLLRLPICSGLGATRPDEDEGSGVASFISRFKKKKAIVPNSSEQVNAAHNTANSLSNNVPSGYQPQRQNVDSQSEQAKGPAVASDDQGRTAVPLSNNEPRGFEQERRNDGLVVGHAETVNSQSEHANDPAVPSDDQGRAAVPLSNNEPRGFEQERRNDGLVLGHAETVSSQSEHANDPAVPSDEQGRAAVPLSNNEPRGFEQERQNDGLVLGNAETLAGPQNSILDRCGNGSADGEGLKACLSWNLKDQLSLETTAIGTNLYPASQEEDVCPICFEDYTTENPKTTLQCNHEFHLGCIYEWMERSCACPFCSKIMLFDEDA